MKTKNQAKDWINSKVGIGIDFDGWYGYQCMDLVVAYMYYVTDGKLTLWGNAKDAIKNDLKGYATLHKNTPQFLPKMGDIAVWTTGNFSEFGHIAIVTSANLDTFNAIEQNWNGGGLTLSEVTTKRKKSYQNVTHFIRPNFKSTSKSKPKPVSKPKPKPKPKPTKKSTSKKNTWNWSGKFTAKKNIKVRKSPSLTNEKNVVEKSSWIKKGDWFDFVQLIKVTKGKKKYWMAKFKYPTNPKAGYFYTTLGEVTDKNEKIKKEKKLYGKIKWK